MAALVGKRAVTWGPRASRQRARFLMEGGLVGAHAFAIPAVGLSFALGGKTAAGWALASSAVVFVFFVIGQGVQVIVAEASPSTVFGASMASYCLRALGLGLLLYFATRHQEVFTNFAPTAVFATIVATVSGWIGGEIFAYSRLDFPVYDHEYVPPADASAAGEGIQ